MPAMDDTDDVAIDMGDYIMDTASTIYPNTTVASSLSSAWSCPAKQSSRYRPLPRTSDARIAQAVPAGKSNNAQTSTATVLYLAYGSNMAAANFQGARGIRPLSAVPVAVPTLRLTFDLPGLPYREPCFANTAVRKLPRVPKKPGVPGVPDLPDLPDLPVPQPPSTGPIRPPFRLGRTGKVKTACRRPAWNGPLYGVVYEVTPDDYARIVATEGGGAAYQEVVVPCLAQQPRMGVPERPIRPPTAFLAKTLWAPQVEQNEQNEQNEQSEVEQDADDDDNDNDDDDDDDSPSWKDRLMQRWNDVMAALVKFSAARMRPDPEYAQPSRRYLGLLAAGAAEHELPDAYQAWLASLAPYEATHWRQRIGALLLVLLSLPFLVVMLGCRHLTSDTGRMPLWAQVGMGAVMHGVWVVYDHVLQPIFGDGEHTEDEEEEDESSHHEKMPLMDEYAV